MNTAVEQKPDYIPTSRACAALALTRSTVYHRRNKANVSLEQIDKNRCRKHVAQVRALSEPERLAVYEVLCSPEFADQPPKAV